MTTDHNLETEEGGRRETFVYLSWGVTHHIKKSYTGRVSPEKEYPSEGEVNVLEDPVEGGIEPREGNNQYHLKPTMLSPPSMVINTMP